MHMMKRKFKLSVVVEHDKQGYYDYSPQLQGCYELETTLQDYKSKNYTKNIFVNYIKQSTIITQGLK
jgi:hypothetical protein